MSRRARHSSNDLRELFIDSTTGLITEHGISAVSARTIARKIGYTAGSLYNVFQDLDDLLLLTEGRQLERMHAELSKAVADVPQEGRVRACAMLYLQFCLENSRLWNLVVVHQTGPTKELPPWYAEKLEALVALFDDSLRGLVEDAGARRHQARALWASVHGIASLIISGKAPNLDARTAEATLDTLVSAFLAGIKAEAKTPVAG
jgi:AcrR family transcriptional regulator